MQIGRSSWLDTRPARQTAAVVGPFPHGNARADASQLWVFFSASDLDQLGDAIACLECEQSESGFQDNPEPERRKLTDDHRADVRAAHAAGSASLGELAARFGVTTACIAYALDPESARLKAKLQRQATSERTNALRREWSAQHPHKIRSYRDRRKVWIDSSPKARNYYANSIGAPGDGYTVEQWQAVCRHVWARRCAYCDRLAVLTVDHVVPLDRGGSHYPENLVPACQSCNSSKRNRLLSEWRGGAHAHIAAFAVEVAASVDLILAAA